MILKMGLAVFDGLVEGGWGRWGGLTCAWGTKQEYALPGLKQACTIT
jgi:hypothetical protein